MVRNVMFISGVKVISLHFPRLQIHSGDTDARMDGLTHKQVSFRKIWGFHGGDYEEWYLLGCYAVWLL
jgi:hypothetical protein